MTTAYSKITSLFTRSRWVLLFSLLVLALAMGCASTQRNKLAIMPMPELQAKATQNGTQPSQAKAILAARLLEQNQPQYYAQALAWA